MAPSIKVGPPIPDHEIRRIVREARDVLCSYLCQSTEYPSEELTHHQLCKDMLLILKEAL